MIGLQIVKIFLKNYQAVLNKNGNDSSQIQANQILLSLKKVVQLLYHFLHHQCGVPVCWEAEGLGELECC